MAVLEVVKGLSPGTRFSLTEDISVLGRHPDCNVVLDVAAVSRQHAQILQESGDYYLQDLGSRNGTFLNGSLIGEKLLLKEGDQFVICDIAFTFHRQWPPTSPTGETSIALLVDDVPDSTISSSIMSKLDVSSSPSGIHISAKPEVKLTAMIEISQSLANALSLDDVLPKLLDSLFKVFLQADRGFVVLQSPGNGVLIPKAIKFRRQEEDTARISRTIVRRAMESKEAILSTDATSDSRFDMSQSLADMQIRSMMCVPLINAEGSALGVIQIDTVDQRSRFTDRDLEVLASVGAQAAIAIDNAQMHEHALRQRALERDLELAHRIQQGLVPSETPVLSGYHFFHFYQAANLVGGDYYDYIQLPANRIAVVLGDVAGKGVAAALLMAKLSGEVRFNLASHDDVAVAVQRINATFDRPDWEDRFVTFVAAIIDPSCHELTLVNAGHMAPFLRHHDGRVEELGKGTGGLPLGVDRDSPYEPYTCTLDPGDFVTLFTDGVSEAMNAQRELYGLDNLRQQIAGEATHVVELGRRILDDVRRFVGNHPQNDDICITCFGRAES